MHLTMTRLRRKIGMATTRALAAVAMVSAGLLATVPLQAQVKEVEVQAFRGGYGLDFFEKAAEEFNKANSGAKVTVSGAPHVWESLRVRLAAGTPPDLMWPGWGMDLRPVVMNGQLAPWDEYLDQPAYGVPGKTWRETFNPDILKKGQFNGKTYVLPYNIDAYGWWYDKKLFEKHGWTAPATYEEFLVLGEKMKAEGIAPLTFTGRYPIYFLNGIFYPWVVSEGGLEAFNDISNLEPGAWRNPAVLKVAQRVMELKKKGYFQGGCIGMNHTEAQMELLVHRAAMVPCGSWIQAEMQNLLPPEFELTFMKTPHFEAGKGDPTALYVGPDGKGWSLPVKGKNRDVAAEYYRYLSSPQKVADFIEQKGTMNAVATERPLNLPPHLEGPFAALQKARVTWCNDIGDWYTELETDIESEIVNMYNEVITPEEFVERLEAESQAFSRKLGDNKLRWD